MHIYEVSVIIIHKMKEVQMSYYYHQLSKIEQKAYYAIKEGLKAMAPSFTVPLLDGKRLSDIYFMVRMDCPEIFYSVKFSYRYYKDSENAELIPEYLFPKAKMIEHRKAMEARVKKLARQAEKLSEKEKELFIHDFLCENVHYDKLKKAYSHEIIGPLGQGVGVCEGIAKSVKILCDALGIWCIIALCDNNPEKGIKYRHMWNVVRIEGKYYHLDVTFDNSLSKNGVLRYDYFNLSDAQVFKDHEPVIYKIPECTDGEHTYYREKKLSWTKYEDVRKRAAQAVKKGKVLVFHWRGGYLTKEVLKELFEIFHEEAAKKEKYAYLSLNWPQAVLQVRFSSEVPQKEIMMEEANEGETLERGEVYEKE